MKKIILIVLSIGLSLSSFSSNAVSMSGSGCGIWGPVTFIITPERGTSLVLIDGSACFISNHTHEGSTLIASVLSEALTSGKSGYLTVVTTGLDPIVPDYVVVGIQ